MNILLTSIGTRGDMEPFLAIGSLLKARGHRVVCLFPEQFRVLSGESELEFATLGSEFIDMLNSPDGKAALGGSTSGFRKIRSYIRLAGKYRKINRKIIERQYEAIEEINPDIIVHNAKAVYPVIWGQRWNKPNILVSPVPYLNYVEGHSHLVFNTNLGAFFNKLSFAIAEFGLAKTIMTSVKWLGLRKEISQRTIVRALRSNKTIYTISPSLFPRPDYWSENLQVLGYHERDKTAQWEPKPALSDFLKHHPRVLFVTFGSMTNPDPEGKTSMMLDILERNNIPAIINTAAGGLEKPDAYNKELIHFIDRIPYDWIFPRVYGVIHHGGSGTTHVALKNGCASMIVPHIIDQFVWNSLIAEQGVGPKGPAIDKIRPKRLEELIIDLWTNEGYKERAELMARRMETEQFEETLIGEITG